MPTHFICVTLGGARERAIRQQFDELNVCREEGEESFELAFSRGVKANQLRSIKGLRSEVCDVLDDLGWQDARLISELAALTASCDDEEVRVLACSFAHLRAMRHASSLGAVVLEDNVRFVQASAHREARELQAALQVLLRQSEETKESAINADAKIPASPEATAAVVGLWYWGYMGRADDLITAHSSSKNSVSGNVTCTTALVPFPPGNVPLWGCYAYAPLPAGWNALRSYLMARGPSALFEEKRRKKACNDSGPNGRSNIHSSKGRGSISSASTGRRVALPIDRLLPRRVRAAGLGLWRAEKPLAFRMPPPHPSQTAVPASIPIGSLSPRVAAEAASTQTTTAAEASAMRPAEDSAPMASAIHPHFDLRFYAATTLQLQLTGRYQEAETGHSNLVNAAGENTSTYTTVAGWGCLWMLPGEKVSVALFQQDQHRRVATVPGAHWLLRPRNTVESSSDDVSNSSAPFSSSHEHNGLDQGDDADINKWRGGDSTAALSASSARTAIAQATTTHCANGSEIEKLVNAVMAAVFVVGDRLGKLFPDAPANQVALMDAARWLSTYCRESTTITHCDSSSRTNRNGRSSIEPVPIKGSVQATAERGLCFVLRLLARAGSYTDADEVLSLLLSSSVSTPITSSSVECNAFSTNSCGGCSENAADDDVDSSDNVNSIEVNVRSSATAIQLLSAPQQSPAWRHAAEALGMAINDPANKEPEARSASVSPSHVVLTDPVVGPFLEQLATDLAENNSVENFAPSSPNEDVVLVETESEDAEEVGKVKNADTASVKQHLAWRLVSRCDLDCALLKLLEARIDSQGGSSSKNGSNNSGHSNHIGPSSSAVSANEASLTLRGALHDWFLGLSALAAHGPTVLLATQKAEVSSSPPLQSSSARTSSSLVSCCPHVGPDLKTLCATVAFLCDQGFACDAHWLLATLGPSLVGPTHQLPTFNLVSPSPQINGSLEEVAGLQTSETKTATARSGSPLVQALSCTGDPAEVLRSLLVGACACGDASAAAWALRDGGIWTKARNSTDEQGEGLMAYGPLPLRVARAVMKHIGRCCGTSDSTGDDSNNCDDYPDGDGNDSGENGVYDSSSYNYNSIALLSIACEILDAVALTLLPKQAYSKALMESTTRLSHVASTPNVASSAALAAERLATVLFDSAVASGALHAAALATRWRRMLLQAATTATPKAVPAVTIPAGLIGGDMNVNGKTAATSPGKDATAAAATAGVQWGSPEWSTKVDEAMGLLAACTGAHEHWVDADQAVCSLVNGTRQGKSGEITSLPWIREPISSNASGVDEHNEDVTKSTDHSGSEVEQQRLNPLRWLFETWPPQTAAPGVLEPPRDVETCSIAAAGCLQWLPLPLARLLVRDCYAKPQSWRRGSGGGVKLISKRAAWLRRVVYFCCASSLELPDPARYDHHSLSRNDPATRDRELGTAHLLSSLEGSESGLNMPCLSSFACGLRWVNAFAEVRGASDARVLEEDITHGLCCRIAHVTKTIRENSRYQGCGNHVDSSSLSSDSVAVIEHREGAVAALELILGALSSAVALDLCSVKSGDKLLALALRALESAVCQAASPLSTTTSTAEESGSQEGTGNPYNVGAEMRAALEDRAARFLMASLALYSTTDVEASCLDIAHDWDGDNQAHTPSDTEDSGSLMSLHSLASTLSFGFGAPLPPLLLATLARRFHLFESKATSEASTPPPVPPSSDATMPPTAPSSSLNSTRREKLRAAYAAALASSLHRAAAESLYESFSRAVSKAAAKDKFATAGLVLKDAMEPKSTQAFAWRVDLPALGLGAAEPLFSAHGAWLRDAVGCEPCFAAGFALLVAAAPPHSPQALKKCVASGGNASSSNTSWKEALRVWVRSPQPLEALAAAASRAVLNANSKEGTTAVAVAVMKLEQSVKTALQNLAKDLQGEFE